MKGIVAFLIIAGCGASRGLWAQTRDSNPYSSQRDIAEGRRLYSFFCVFCHGMDGASGRGARLASTFRRHGVSDRDQYRVIADGVPGTEMSAHLIQEDEIWKILAFVRTLERSATASNSACESGTGDAAIGRKLFFGKGGCLQCHSATIDGRVEGKGRLGPDLTYAGATRTREYLRESLLEPDRAVAPGYRQVRVVTAAGATHRGLLLSEDEYTLHLMEAGEQIRSLFKGDLRTVDRLGESFMPSYRSSLAPREMEDLLSYLCTLRGNRQ